MVFENHVSLSTDLVGYFDYSPGYISAHQYLGFTPPFELPMAIHSELMTTMWWVPGFAIGQNKFSDDVFHKSDTIALEGHDVGAMIIHPLSVPPDNVLLVVTILKSKRKVNFSAGDVKANGNPIAACTMLDVGIVPTPMSFCSLPTNIPLCGTGSALVTNSVIVGMHWVDVVAGYATIAVDAVFDLLFAAAGGEKPGFIPNMWEVVPGLIRLAGQEWFGYRGDAKVKVTVSAGPAERSVYLSRSGEDGRWTAGSEGRLGPELANVHDNESVSWGGSGGEGVVGTGQVGGGLLGQSADVGASNHRPGDGEAGMFGSGESVFGGGSAPLAPSIEDLFEL